MLISDSFVLLNNPRTGSTFARGLLKQIHERRRSERSFARKASDLLGITKGPRLTEWLEPNFVLGYKDQHGSYEHIPERARELEVISIARDPAEQLLSEFEFRWWATHPGLEEDVLTAEFPSFPELSFSDFLRLMNRSHGLAARRHGCSDRRILEAGVGFMSIKFILMFFVNPFQVLRNLTSEYVESDEVFNDCAPVTFLRQEFLRDELSAFLERHGYEPSEIALVRQMSPVNASEPIAGYGRDELRAEAERYTRDRERLIYRVLERRGILYPP